MIHSWVHCCYCCCCCCCSVFCTLLLLLRSLSQVALLLQAFVVATAYVALSILLSGFYIRVADMAVSVMRGLSWISYTKYASAHPPFWLWGRACSLLTAAAANGLHHCCGLTAELMTCSSESSRVCSDGCRKP